jgi:hypothetical protein
MLEREPWDGGAVANINGITRVIGIVSATTQSYQSGYNEGLKQGRYDLSKHRPYQPEKYKAYKNGDEVYRRGFIDGYNEGCGRRPQ